MIGMRPFGAVFRLRQPSREPTVKKLLIVILVVSLLPTAFRALAEYRASKRWEPEPIEVLGPIPERFAGRTEVAFLLDDPVPEPLPDGERLVSVRLINPTAAPIYIYGNPETRVETQVFVDDVWTIVPQGNGCRTYPFVIPPGHSKVVVKSVKDGAFPVKIGMTYFDSTYTYDGRSLPLPRYIWSDPIDKPEQ